MECKNTFLTASVPIQGWVLIICYLNYSNSIIRHTMSLCLQFPGTLSPLAQTLGPVQRSSHTTKGSWRQMRERAEPVLFQGPPGLWLTGAQCWGRAHHPTIRGSCLLFTVPQPLPVVLHTPCTGCWL